MSSSVISNGKKFVETDYKSEDEFEKIVRDNYKILFGQKTILFDIKGKIETKNLGSSIPDGFLFDFHDEEDLQFYLVEVEL